MILWADFLKQAMPQQDTRPTHRRRNRRCARVKKIAASRCGLSGRTFDSTVLIIPHIRNWGNRGNPDALVRCASPRNENMRKINSFAIYTRDLFEAAIKNAIKKMMRQELSHSNPIAGTTMCLRRQLDTGRRVVKNACSNNITRPPRPQSRERCSMARGRQPTMVRRSARQRSPKWSTSPRCPAL